MMDSLTHLDDQSILNKNLALHSRYYVIIGKTSNFKETDLVTESYNTDLRSYTYILGQAQPIDKSILAFLGKNRVLILKHFLESNTGFEAVDIRKVLNESTHL